MVYIMNKYIYFFVFMISSVSCVAAEDLARSVALGKSSNFTPVGYINVISEKDDNGMSEGTATHIGNGLLITAAHNLADLFPKRVPQSGPVVIDVSSREVYWSNNQSSSDIENAKVYRVKKVVVDARFIKLYKKSGGAVSHDAVAHDVAFMQLHETPKTGSIPLANHISVIPDFGVLVGYGNLSFSLKHAFVQTIGLRAPLNKSREIISDVERYDIIDYVESKASRRESCNVVYGRKCEPFDIFSFDSSPGDSGGPLLVNLNGKVAIIGIMSYGGLEQIPDNEFAYDDPSTPINETKEFTKNGVYFLGSNKSLRDPIVTASINGYVSIVSGQPGNFQINKDLESLLNAISK